MTGDVRKMCHVFLGAGYQPEMMVSLELQINTTFANTTNFGYLSSQVLRQFKIIDVQYRCEVYLNRQSTIHGPV